MGFERKAQAAFRRAGWGVGDQMLSSLSNFGLSLFVARSVSTEAFGAFAVVMVAYQLAASASRSLAGETYTSGVHTDAVQSARAAVGLGLLVGVATGLVCYLISAFVGGAVGRLLAVLAVLMPGLLVQDAWRYVFFGTADPKAAAKNDALWTILQVIGVCLLLAFDRVSLYTIVGAWGTAALIAGLYGSRQFRHIPAGPIGAWVYLGHHRKMGLSYLADATARAGAGAFVVLIFAAFFGLRAAGQLRAAQLLMGPVNVFQLSVLGYGVAEIRTLRLSHKWAQLRRAVEATSGVLAVVCLATGAAAFVIPEALGTALFGSAWLAALPVLLPVAIKTAGNSSMSTYNAALRGIAAHRALARLRLSTTSAILATATIAAAWSSLTVGLWSVAAVTVGSAIIWRRSTLSAIRGCQASGSSGQPLQHAPPILPD